MFSVIMRFKTLPTALKLITTCTVTVAVLPQTETEMIGMKLNIQNILISLCRETSC